MIEIMAIVMKEFIGLDRAHEPSQPPATDRPPDSSPLGGHGARGGPDGFLQQASQFRRALRATSQNMQTSLAGLGPCECPLAGFQPTVPLDRCFSIPMFQASCCRFMCPSSVSCCNSAIFGGLNRAVRFETVGFLRPIDLRFPFSKRGYDLELRKQWNHRDHKRDMKVS